MRIAASAETPATIASHSRQLPTVKMAPFHGSLKVTIEPTTDAAMPMRPATSSTGVDATFTSSNFSGYARLTRYTSANSRTIDRHQITVTPAWKMRYTCAGKFPFWAHGPNVTIVKIDAITVCNSTAFTGTFVFSSTF